MNRDQDAIPPDPGGPRPSPGAVREFRRRVRWLAHAYKRQGQSQTSADALLKELDRRDAAEEGRA